MNYKERDNIAKETILRKILDSEARERLKRIEIVRPKFASQVANYLIALYSAGRIRKVINDEEFKRILILLNRKREFKIIRK